MRYSWIVYSSPVKGRETAYNEWYDKHHLPDLLKIPGVTSARRYRIAKDQRGGPATNMSRYMAVYELDTDDLKGLFAEVVARRGTPAMVMSDALDPNSISTEAFELITA